MASLTDSGSLTDSDRADNFEFIKALRDRVQAGDPDIPAADFTRYRDIVSAAGARLLSDEWKEAKANRVLVDLIAQCTRSKWDHDEGVLEQSVDIRVLLHRQNLLLAAILLAVTK